MFRHLMVFIYIFATFLGMAGLSLFWLISRQKRLDNAAQHISLQKFAFITFLMGLFTFSIYYREYIAFIQTSIAALKLLDYLLWVSFIYFWINYLSTLFYDSLLNKLTILVKSLSVVYIILWFYATFVVMDNTFNMSIKNDRILLIAMDIVYGLSAMVVTFLFVIKGRTRINSSLTFGYVFLISVLLAFYSLWGSYRYFEIYSGVYSPIMWVHNPFNATAILLFFTNFFTLVYLYHTDFADSYVRIKEPAAEDTIIEPIPTEVKTEVKTPTVSFEENLNAIAAAHNLTLREKEIILLVYKGYNNAEIAEELFISQNTVKHHVYNIFKKMNVKNRVELICMFQE